MDTSTVTQQIDDWLANLPDDPVKLALDELRATEHERLATLDQLQRDLVKIQLQIEKLEGALALKRRWLEAPRGSGAAPGPAESTEKLRGRAAVLRLFGDFPHDKEWKIPEVVRELAIRGWANEDDDHAVGVALSRLARRGQVRRPRKGVYLRALPVGSSNDQTGEKIEAGAPLSRA